MGELKRQFSGALLIVLTVAAVVCAGINLQQQRKFRLPEDGITWVDRPTGVQALYVTPGSPGEKAGLREGDLLKEIASRPVPRAVVVPQILEQVGSWNEAQYTFHRAGVDVTAKVFIGERTPDSSVYYLYGIGAAYLFIGLFVYFRRGSADKALHFYILCLASFVLFTFHYTGKLNGFDKAMYWGNVAAGLLAPTIFLHFCLAFPHSRGWWRGWRAAMLYLPATLLLGLYVAFASGSVRLEGLSLVEIRWMLDRLWLPFLVSLYVLGSLVLRMQERREEDPIRRKQLKWLWNGALFGTLPFAVFYVLPYTLGGIPDEPMKISVFALAIIPVAWAYAIVRYRLMDVDVILQQGYVYTISTLLVLGIAYALVFTLGKFEEISTSAIILLILIAAFVFQPVRNWLQEQFDKHIFYKDRYDYRRTLIEFARELSSETDLDTMLDSVADRLTRTLSIHHLAFFLLDEQTGRFELRSSFNLRDRAGQRIAPGRLDLSFLPVESREQTIFFEQTRHALDVVTLEMPASVRQTIADLDLTYYVPCRVRGRIIAYLGLSRTDKSDFLTSDDLELLQTLSGYVGIAIENARLYRSLQHKVIEYERLKEFSENIVESISVGIVAADLDDRVDSWNAQMERLTGISREYALGRKLEELFPPELAARFETVRSEDGIENIYKYHFVPSLIAAGASAETVLHGNGGPHAAALLSAAVAGVAAGATTTASNGTEAEAMREITLNIAITPLFSKEMDRIGRLIIFDDVTDRTALERRLLQADKLSSVGLLAAGVAHEVNTPLAVISTYAQMLAKQVTGDDTKSRLLDKIAKQTFRASEIVNSLLNFSRTSPTSFDELNLNQVLRETLTLVEHQLHKAGVEVATSMEDRLATVRGNAGKLQQVFLNLILNARDAMEGGGKLEIRTYSLESTVGVEVIDSGQGIDPDHLHRIYDPFFTTKAARRGTGLGLSVTYGIVKEHGGIIEVDSKLGVGTRFHLEFPMSRKPVNA